MWAPSYLPHQQELKANIREDFANMTPAMLVRVKKKKKPENGLLSIGTMKGVTYLVSKLSQL